MLSQSKFVKPFKIRKISWDYMLCYLDGNSVNFETLENKITAINARNGHGKTNFLEVVCLALFGEGFPSRVNKKYSTSIINTSKPGHTPSFTCIELELFDHKDSRDSRDSRNKDLNQDTMNIDTNQGPMHKGVSNKSKHTIYIYREWSSKKTTPNKLDTTHKKILVYTKDKDNNQTIIKCGKTAVDNWVKENIGSIDSFLLSCMITQNSDNDFSEKATRNRNIF